ncbi:MAG TPA: sigma-54 dependent transcriptional regulator [bacterium]|nr:sigma-54 dependent transcriptional regulator [bacterium]
MAPDTPAVLIVDDERATADAFAELLADDGHRTLAAHSLAEAVALLQRQEIFLLVTDLRLGSESGLTLVEQARQRNPGLPVIVVTAYGTITSAVEAMKLGIEDYLTKPVDLEKLRLVVRNAAERAVLRRENAALRTQLARSSGGPHLIGDSEAMRAVQTLIDKVAKSKATVLVRGESGTGKGLVARAIHYRSRRSDRVLLEVNCASIPETLLESELFGHVRGAFTGATTERKGRFAEAGDGTILLDEIGELPLTLQAKLLRVLQERLFEPLGSNQSQPALARVIAVTNRDLEAAVNARQFREDLYYRLQVVPICLPPLRARKEDIPALTEFFLDRSCAENECERKRLAPAALARLQAHDWPGNVRELENLIERLVIMTDGPCIEAQEIDFLRARPQETLLPESAIGNLPGRLEQHERDIIARTLTLTNGNRTKAAHLLHISIRQLHYKLVKYNLS